MCYLDTLTTHRFIPVLTGNGVILIIKFRAIAVYPRAYGERLTTMFR